MARSFNGTTDKITASLPTTTTGPFTVSGWGYTTNTATTRQPIVYLGSGASNGYGLFIVTGSGGGTRFAALFGGIAWLDVVGAPSPPSANTWYHMAITYPGGGNSIIYVNGTGVIIATTAPNAPTGNLTVGTDGTGFLAGRATDCAVWNVVLTAAEVKSLSQGARPFTIREPNMVWWLPIDGLQSPEADLSGGARNGTLTGTALAFGAPFAPQTPRWTGFFPAPPPPPPLLTGFAWAEW